MTAGQRVSATVNPDASGGTDPDKTVTAGDFTASDGTALGASDAVIVTGYLHESDVTFNRLGDPDGDGTFEISVGIESRTGAGERTDIHHVVTDVAGIEVVNDDTGAGQHVTLYGVRVDATKVFVVQAAGVAGGSEIARTTGARGQEETLYEAVMSGAADLIRRHDPNDDNTFELDATVETGWDSADVKRELGLAMKDESGRTNAEMETALQASGGARDLMLAGSIGVEL